MVSCPPFCDFDCQNKKPAELLCFSGPETWLLANSAAHPRRRAMRVMAMMMVMSKHERFKLRDGLHPVNSKELMDAIGIHDGVHLFAIWRRSTPSGEAC
jgi:hypothetical protein